jgi:hypothetical protein
MPDVNEIKGGEYELLADSWDETTSEPDKPYTFKRHYKGDLVTLSEEDARRLVPVGAVGEPGAREKAQLEVAKAQYLAALAAVPDALRSQITEEQALEAFGREIPVEELTVATAPGHPNVGERPRVAEASTGEGTGGPENTEAVEESTGQEATPEKVAEEAEEGTTTVSSAKRSGRTGRGADV